MNNLNLNKKELNYLKMIMNPFESLLVKEPTNFPRPTKLLKSMVRNTLVLRTSIDRYLEICFNPGNLLKNDYTLYPVIASTYKHGPMTSNITDVFYFKTCGTYSSTFFDGTNLRYVKPIASAIRSRLLYSAYANNHQGRATGNMTPSYEQAYGTNVTMKVGTTPTDGSVPYSLSSIYSNPEYTSGTTPIYFNGGVGNTNEPIYCMCYGEWITTFMRPQTMGTSGYRDNFEYYNLDTNVPYGTNKYLHQAWSLPNTVQNPTFEIEAVTIWEATGLNIPGSLNYDNTPYGKYSVLQYLQGVPTYKGDMNNFAYPTLI